LVAVRTQALERASNTDPLTQAWNRRYFHARIGSWLGESENGDGLWLLLIDIDHFKQINDRYGHAVGDAVLVEIAARLQALDSHCSELIRWGGEEFLLVWRDQSDSPISARVLAALTGVSATPVTVAGQQVQVRCSIGFTRCRPPAEGVDEHIDLIVGRADVALYRAKEQGRNRAVEAGAGDSSQWRMLVP
jgi:diguanylate cyclase (GGDEF)-like protein